MRKDLEERLFEDFPDLYCRYYKHTGLFPFRIRCRDGREPLLRRLSERITRIVQSFPLEAPASVDDSPISMDTSIKTGQHNGLTAQSFCADVVSVDMEGWKLRFWMNESTKEIEQVIQDAVEESMTTCEMCGRPGELSVVPYIVACDDHDSPVGRAIKFSVWTYRWEECPEQDSAVLVDFLSSTS